MPAIRLDLAQKVARATPPNDAAIIVNAEGSTMAETTKLSVEKALGKLRKDSPKCKDQQRDEKMEALDTEIRRMRAQRLRLERQALKRG